MSGPIASEPESSQKPGPVTLLLGAGASVPVGIPHTLGFVEVFEKELSGRPPELKTAYERLRSAWEAIVPRRALDLERLYELLSWINGEEIEPPIPLDLSPKFPKRSRETDLLLWDLKKLIQGRCLGFGPLTRLEPLVALAREFSPLTVLSLNYDTCIETLLDNANVPWDDGFPQNPPEPVPWSLPAISEADGPRSDVVRLVKLHGSASWYQPSPGWMLRGMGTTQHGVGLGLGTARTMTAEAMMVYPTLNKALADGPFPTLLATAQRRLATSTLCLAIGYAFGDVHVRRLVLGALAVNSDLKLVIVNPGADAVIEVLLGEAGAEKFRHRIGVPSLEKSRKGYVRGFVENALRGGWLLDRCRAWLEGAPLTFPEASHARKRLGGRPWHLCLEVQGGVRGLALRGSKLGFVEPKSKEIKTLDLDRGEVQVVSREFLYPRGIAWNDATGSLFVVENIYRLGRGRASLALAPTGLNRKGASGIGRVWELRERKCFARPVTTLRLASLLSSPQSFLRAARHQLERGELWNLLVGALRWPASVLVEPSGTSLLITQANRLTRLDLTTGRLSFPFDIPLCTNLGGLALLNDQTVWMIDAGLYPNGEGRWMQGDLQTGEVTVIAHGWRLLHGITYLHRKGLALLSFGGPQPHGQIIALDPKRPTAPPLHRWVDLDGPGTLCPSEDERTVFVATRQGIVELEI